MVNKPINEALYTSYKSLITTFEQVTFDYWIFLTFLKLFSLYFCFYLDHFDFALIISCVFYLFLNLYVWFI